MLISKQETTAANKEFFCKPILVAICTSTFSKLFKNIYNGM
jgi:hypothetical protein